MIERDERVKWKGAYGTMKGLHKLRRVVQRLGGARANLYKM